MPLFAPIRLTVCIAACGLLTLATATRAAETPKLGFQGTIVALGPRAAVPAPDGVPNRGLRVDSVKAGTPAARMGLERGDILIAIDTMRFTSLEGYYQALRCSGQRPSIILINVRNGQLTRKSTALPHAAPPDEECGARPPHSYLMSIDLRSDFQK